ncbi:endoribonuclease SymE [Raoultella sp. T31]|uniref:endoribonuclease SymE n=1 Tax=Raoultella sp. T31 TaxID=2054594 RepID=UPI000C28D5AF|nr:endoribonuclease SymE [Raoultella sp. T31]
MTIEHSISDPCDPEVSPTNNRHLTVSYATRNPDYQRIPALIMKGQWLEAAGFATGTEVDLKVMNGCIVITARQPELTASLRQISKLSARKQKQVQVLIDAIAGQKPKLA